MAIMGGVLTILTFLFVKETLYIPKERALPPPKTLKDRLNRLKFNPVSKPRKHFLTILLIINIGYSLAVLNFCSFLTLFLFVFL
jgi:hypothetical protein